MVTWSDQFTYGVTNVREAETFQNAATPSSICHQQLRRTYQIMCTVAGLELPSHVMWGTHPPCHVLYDSKLSYYMYIVHGSLRWVGPYVPLMGVNLNGIPYRLRLVCTPLCICSLSFTYRIIQGLLTRKSETPDFFSGELRANS
jgi:hypothetical protein